MASLKLLIVEDDIASLELMTEVFTLLQAEVRPVSDSQKGVGLVNQIRKSSWNKSTPIIIVTGRDERQTMQEAFSIGATFFLQKPVDRHKLSILFRAVRGGMLENRRRSTRVPIQTDVTCEMGFPDADHLPRPPCRQR